MEKKIQQHLCNPSDDPNYALKVIFSETRKGWALQIDSSITGTNHLMIGINHCPWCGKKLSK